MKEFKKGGKYLLIYLDTKLIYHSKNDYNTYCPNNVTTELFSKKKDMEDRIIELGLTETEEII